jgi:hypothetical protein
MNQKNRIYVLVMQAQHALKALTLGAVTKADSQNIHILKKSVWALDEEQATAKAALAEILNAESLREAKSIAAGALECSTPVERQKPTLMPGGIPRRVFRRSAG